MSQETGAAAAPAESVFMVTHYRRPVDHDYSSLTLGSGEVSSAEAIALIQRWAAEASDLGLSEPAAVAIADPTPPATGGAGVPAVASDSGQPAGSQSSGEQS